MNDLKLKVEMDLKIETRSWTGRLHGLAFILKPDLPQIEADELRAARAEQQVAEAVQTALQTIDSQSEVLAAARRREAEISAELERAAVDHDAAAAEADRILRSEASVADASAAQERADNLRVIVDVLKKRQEIASDASQAAEREQAGVLVSAALNAADGLERTAVTELVEVEREAMRVLRPLYERWLMATALQQAARRRAAKVTAVSNAQAKEAPDSVASRRQRLPAESTTV